MIIKEKKQGFKIIHTKYRGDFEIPDKWDLVRLGSATKLEYGKGLTEENRSNDGFPVFGSGGLVGYHSKFLKEGPGVIVPRKGSLGNVHYTNENFWAIDTVYYITKNETVNHLKFLYYLLKFLKLENYKIVTAHPGISRDEVYTIFVRLPSIPEQQKIASILSNIDSLIQKTQKKIEQTQKLKKGLTQKLLTKGIGHTKFKKINLVPRFINFEIPEKWEVQKLEKISSEIKDGPMGFALHKYDYTESGIPLIRILNLQNLKVTKDNLRFISLEKHHQLKKSQVKPLDIIISKTGILGSIGIVPEEYGPANLNQALARISLKDKRSVYYVAMFLSSKIPQQILEVVGSSRTVQAGLKMSDIKNLQIPIPRPTDEQTRIIVILSNVDSKIQQQQEYKFNLETLKKGLMQKLLTGQMRVKI